MADDEGASLLEGSSRPFGLPRPVGAALPLVLLAVLLGVLVVAQPFAGVQTGAPLPDVSISHVTLPHDEAIVLHVVNNGPDPISINQVLVNEAYWDFSVGGGGPDAETLGALERATVTIPYHWTPGWDVEVALLLADGTTIHHTIVAPAVSPGMSLDVLGLLAVVGIMVGVIPVALGMLWFPFMRDLADRWLHALLLFAAGVLAFLAFDAGFEAFEVAEAVPGAYEGPLLVVSGVVGAALLVQAVAARGSAGGEPDALTVAYLVALGIGLHNLAEGLAIGSSFALGRVSLGAFLVVGFMVHNVTEGPAVVAPLSRGERPALRHFLALGALAGAPVILGGWIGGLAFSPTLGAFFLAIGVGAILQVDWEIARMVRARGRLGTATNILGFLAGFAVMYATDLLVAL
ncbi:MAG: metal transporter [Halobacteriales archaeon]|nr:metal transporter [Halobacteriales archaeon]